MVSRSIMYEGSDISSNEQDVLIKDSGRKRKEAVDRNITVVGGNMDGSQTLAADRQFQETSSGDEDRLKRRVRMEMIFAAGLMVLVVALFFLGRIYWDERYYVSEEGLGYYLGLVGGVMMLLAWCYTLFKYLGFLRSRAVMRHWLTIHIFFGVVGPILVMFHSTFHIGSLNGGIAAVAMTLVFISGVMARFVYAKTRFGLGDQKMRVKELQDMLILAGHKIQSKRLDKFTESVTSHRESLLHAIWELLTFGWRSRWIYVCLTENMRQHSRNMAREKGWDGRMLRQKRSEFKKQLREYIFMLKKVSLLNVYERFFAFWRNAHVPLLYLLLMSGIVHVVAVHMY